MVSLREGTHLIVCDKIVGVQGNQQVTLVVGQRFRLVSYTSTDRKIVGMLVAFATSYSLAHLIWIGQHSFESLEPESPKKEKA